MYTSIDAVLRYLEEHDPEAAKAARLRYACFEQFGKEPQAYGLATMRYGKTPCEEEVVAQLVELRQRATALIQQGEPVSKEDLFFAEQNARLINNAENYYRSMFRGRDESWNQRDTHMFETLGEIAAYSDGTKSKLVVLAHNSDLGNAKATEMHDRGELNLGQLMKEHDGDRTFAIGFSTYDGTVTAARDLVDSAHCWNVMPGIPGSYEELFHEVGLPGFWLDLRKENAATELLQEPRFQRAIGVIYRPETERWGHYYHAQLPRQFDAMIHIDRTNALTPIDSFLHWSRESLVEKPFEWMTDFF